jgi:hypothetical protein
VPDRNSRFRTNEWGFEELEERSLLLAVDFAGADLLPQPFRLRFEVARGKVQGACPGFPGGVR